MVYVDALDVAALITLNIAFMSKFNYHKAMADGHGYNLYVADLLAEFGIPKVDVPEFTIATTHDEIKDKTLNEKDIVVDDLILEVKSSSRWFRDIDDFPHNPLIVDTVYGFDSKIIKPFAYVIISQKTHNLFVIPVATKYDWVVQEYYDAQRDITERFYMVQKRHCRPFIELVDILLERANERTNQMQ
jgi:hypothetical protein